MSLALSIIAVIFAAFDLGVNISFLFSRTFIKRDTVKLSAEEIYRQQREQAALTAAAENSHADTAESTMDSAVNDGEAAAEDSDADSADGNIEYTEEEVLESFGITKINDYIHVQKQVIGTLKGEGFFTDEGGTSTTVTNGDSGIVVEVNTKGIKETFNGDNYAHIGKSLKYAKLATIRYIPSLIENGVLTEDNVKNTHGANKTTTFAYIKSQVLLNGEPITITIAIKKSQQKNKFWVHMIDINNVDGSQPAGVSKDSITGYQTSVDDNTVSQSETDVKEDFAKTDQGGFSDVPDSEIYREMTAEDRMMLDAVRDYRTPRQRQTENVAEMFGVKLRWDNSVSEAYYNYETHHIFMNPNLTISEMYAVIFKHELVHHFELKKGYDGFKNYLFKNSNAFAVYAMDKLSEATGVDFKGSYSEAIEEYTKYKYEQYKNSSEIPESLRKRFTMEMAEMEIVADFIGEKLLFGKDVDASLNALEEIALTDRNLFQRIWDWVKDKLARLKKRGEVQDASLRKDLEYLEKRLARVWDSADKKNYNPGAERKYSLREGAENDVERVLSDTKYREDVYLTESSPSIIASQKGVHNLPMLMKASHIRENIFTEQDAMKLGLKVDEHTHYHGLGKDLFLKIIDGLDDVELAYRGTKQANDPSRRENYFLLISQYKDEKGDIINVPVYIDEKGQYNRVFIDTNKIATVFGRSNFNEYINRELRNGNLVRVKNKSTQASERTALIAGSYSKNASDITVPQKAQDVNTNISENGESDTENRKYSLGLAKDSGVDSASRAEAMSKRYGEYETGIEGLKNDLDTMIGYAERSEWTDAHAMAESIIERFAGKNGQEIDTDAAVRYIYNGILMKTVEKQVAQRYEARLERQRERTLERRREVQALKEERSALKEKNRRREQDIREDLEQKRVSREARENNLKEFRKTYNRLNTRLEGNTDAKHIPENLKNTVRAFINAFRSGMVTVDGKQQRARFTADSIALLRGEYQECEFDKKTGEPNIAYDGDIYEFLSELKEKAASDDRGLLTQDLDVYETLMLKNTADNIWQLVKEAENGFQDERAGKFKELSSSCLAELEEHKRYKETRMAPIAWLKNLASGNITPPYFFKHLGGTFYSLYNNIVDGQGKWAVNIDESTKFIYRIQKEYRYYDWNNKTDVLHTERGEKIKLTIEQAMQLYATVKRQLGNRSQDAQHLNIGGIVLEDAISTTQWKKIKSDLRDIADNENVNSEVKKKRTKRVWDAFYDTYSNKAIQLTYNDLMQVGELLNEEQKGYTDAWVDYLTNNMAALGNETSMQLFGYRKYNEDYYIPYNSAENYLYSQPGAPQSEARIKNLSFTKSTQKKASTPLVLSSLSEVCSSHVEKMCMYNALAVPLETLNKVFNCTVYDENGSPTENMRVALEDAFGKSAVDYLKRFIDDANGSIRGSSDDSVANLWISRYKKGAVLASASVVIQQPSAIMRAMAYIKPKYFLHLKDVKGIGKNYEQLCKYAPGVALVKQMGRFDTGVGVSTVKWMLQRRYEGAGSKVKAFFTDSQYRDDKLSYFAAKADEITWAHIWTAVKAEAKAETSLKVGSEEFLQYCGKRFTEVINLTQVYDSTLVKSQHMRDKSAYKAMLTSFMAEPTVTYNMLADALSQAKNKGKSGKLFAAGAGGAVLASIVANVLLKSIIYAARDDDDDKSYIEKYLKSVSGNLLQEMNPLTLVPFARDVYSIWQGYDVERADMTTIGDIISSLKMLGNDNKPIGEKMEKLAGSIANAFGLPVKNVIRDINSVVNVISNFGENETTALGVKYALIEGFTGTETISSYYDRMAEAAEDGNEEKFMEIYSYLIDKGKDDSKIISGAKSALKDTEAVKDKADRYIGRVKSNSSYTALDEDDKKAFSSKIKDVLSTEILDDMLRGSDSEYDKLYEAKRTNAKQYKELKKKLTGKGISESEISIRLFAAEIRYIESLGIDIHSWALAELAKSRKYADTDDSGTVSKAEKQKAIEGLSVDKKTKQSLWSYYGLD